MRSQKASMEERFEKKHLQRRVLKTLFRVESPWNTAKYLWRNILKKLRKVI